MPDETAPRCPILGRREPDYADAVLIAEIRAHGAATRALLSRVRTHLGDGAERLPCGLDEAEAIAWVNVAEQQMQLGQMSLIKAVARDTGCPETPA